MTQENYTRSNDQNKKKLKQTNSTNFRHMNQIQNSQHSLIKQITVLALQEKKKKNLQKLSR